MGFVATHLGLSDFDLFHSLLLVWYSGIVFCSDESINQFLANKDRSFCEGRIMKFTERWQRIIKQNSQYIIDGALLFVQISLQKLKNMS